MMPQPVTLSTLLQLLRAKKNICGVITAGDVVIERLTGFTPDDENEDRVSVYCNCAYPLNVIIFHFKESGVYDCDGNRIDETREMVCLDCKAKKEEGTMMPRVSKLTMAISNVDYAREALLTIKDRLLDKAPDWKDIDDAFRFLHVWVNELEVIVLAAEYGVDISRVVPGACLTREMAKAKPSKPSSSSTLAFGPMRKRTRMECRMEVAGEGYVAGGLAIKPGSRVYFTVEGGHKIIHFIDKPKRR